MEDTMDMDRITVRVEHDVRMQWEERARKQGRPLTNWMRWMLQKCKDEE